MKIDAQVEIGNAHLSERYRGRSMTGEKDRYSEFVT
jgi:hypothetical protein